MSAATSQGGPAIRLRYVLALLSVLAGASIEAQQPADSVVIKSNTRAVQIDAVVKDADGHAVHGLRRDDFAVADEGRPRVIQIFSGEEEVTAVQTPPVLPPGVFSNRFGPRNTTGRITAIVIDGVFGLEVDSSQRGEFKATVPKGNLKPVIYMTLQSKMRAQAIRAVERMQPGDTIAVYVICPDLLLLQDYTADRDRVLHSLNAYSPVYPLKMDRTEAVLTGLQSIAAHMAAAPGRKSVVWISTGFPPPGTLDQDRYDSMKKAFNDANVALYPVNPMGVAVFEDPSPGFVMQELAQVTGGHVYNEGNDVSQAIAEAIDETRYAYELGYYLSAADCDGKFHKLDVKVPAQPKLSLDYRRGYTASLDPHLQSAAKPDLEESLLNPVDADGIGIDAGVKVLPGKAGGKGAGTETTLELSVVLNAAAITRGKDGSVAVEELLVETDIRGTQLAKHRESLQLLWPAALPAARFKRTIELKPGAAILHVVVRDKASGRIGSLNIPLAGLDVPGTAGQSKN